MIFDNCKNFKGHKLKIDDGDHGHVFTMIRCLKNYQKVAKWCR